MLLYKSFFHISYLYFLHLLLNLFLPKYGMWRGQSKVSPVCAYMSIPSLSGLWFMCPGPYLAFCGVLTAFYDHAFGCIISNDAVLLTIYLS